MTCMAAALGILGWQLRAALQREGELRTAVKVQETTITSLRERAVKDAARVAAYSRQLSDAATRSTVMEAEIAAARTRLREARRTGGEAAAAVAASETLQDALDDLRD